MNTALKLLAGVLLLSGLLNACAATGGQSQSVQYSESEKCTRSGGVWRGGGCEPMQGGAGGY